MNKALKAFQIYQSALGFPRQPAAVQILIGTFETVCIPWIPLVAEFGTDHIEKAVDFLRKCWRDEAQIRGRDREKTHLGIKDPSPIRWDLQ